MEEIYELITTNVNILYIFLCNLITYIIIDGILNGTKQTKIIARGWKRLISAISAICIGFCMLIIEIDTPNIERQLFYSFFLQFLTWDYCFKGIVKFLKDKFGSDDDPDDLKEEHELDEIIK